MILARVVGTVVATRKDPRLEGQKLLIVQTVSPEGEVKANSYLIAVDTVGAGVSDTVITVSGSSARMADGLKDSPVDTAVVGIVDQIDLDASHAAAPARKNNKGK
jgi:microcompartment protein CcmK/EutM